MADPTQVIGPAQSGVYTPEAIARRLQIAQQLLDQSKTPPIVHPLQGLNELLKGYLGGEMYGRAENMEARQADIWRQQMAQQMGLQPPPPTVAPYRSPIERIADLFSGKPATATATPMPPPVASVATPSAPLPAPPPTNVSTVPKTAAFNPNPHGDPSWQNADPRTAVAQALAAPPGADVRPPRSINLTDTQIGGPAPVPAPSTFDERFAGDSTLPSAAAPTSTAPYPGTFVPRPPPAQPTPPPGTSTDTSPMSRIPQAKRMEIFGMMTSPSPMIQKMGFEAYKAAIGKEGEVRPPMPGELEKFGVDPKAGPWGIDVNTGAPKMLDPRPITSINQQGMLAGETTYSKGKAEDALTLERSADKALEERSRIDVFRALNQNLKTGKLTPLQATVGAWADALGIDSEKLGIPRNTAMNAQMMETLQNTMTLGMIGGTGGMPANNFSDADRKFLQTTTPGIAKLQGGNEILLEMKQRGLDRQIEKTRMWDEFKAQAIAQGKSPEASFGDFERAWRNHVRSQPSLFADIPDRIKALSSAQPQTGLTAPANATPAESKVLNGGWSVKKVE